MKNQKFEKVVEWEKEPEPELIPVYFIVLIFYSGIPLWVYLFYNQFIAGLLGGIGLVSCAIFSIKAACGKIKKVYWRKIK